MKKSIGKNKSADGIEIDEWVAQELLIECNPKLDDNDDEQAGCIIETLAAQIKPALAMTAQALAMVKSLHIPNGEAVLQRFMKNMISAG